MSNTLPQTWYDLQLTKLIHENFSVIVTHAFSQPSLLEWVERYNLYSKYLEKSCFGLSEERANLAVLQFAVLVRTLIDYEPLPELYKDFYFGQIIRKNGEKDTLDLRDTTNKIIHSSRLYWSFDEKHDPKIVCYPHTNEKRDWVKAEIHITKLAALCTSLMF
jgi:hypothetical protein